MANPIPTMIQSKVALDIDPLMDQLKSIANALSSLADYFDLAAEQIDLALEVIRERDADLDA